MEATWHNVDRISIETKTGDNYTWLSINIRDKDGKKIGEITLFANPDKNISFSFGDE